MLSVLRCDDAAAAASTDQTRVDSDTRQDYFKG